MIMMIDMELNADYTLEKSGVAILNNANLNNMMILSPSATDLFRVKYVHHYFPSYYLMLLIS